MSSFSFKKWNTILGWSVFAIALITYWLTVEPTASFWDAGEYITTASNLEVGHPPGAPLYQLMGAFFSIFAMEPTNIALTINLMSVFASAFTILFMFWSVTILLTNIVAKNDKLTTHNQIAILGSAAVGALSFTFTDSFWYSAVEAEVYAMAIFIMSVLFYAGLRWERDMNNPRGDKWVVLISFLVGLSFGVHFMGLLTIPAIGFLYFFKNTKKVTVKNFIIANFVTVAILLFIFKLLLPMTMRFFSASEIFFVNSIGLPFNSGTLIAGLMFIALFYFGLKYTRAKSYVKLNTLLLCVLFIFIGFSSWLMLPIRANAGTVINENNPNNARELLAYYNREQYPETHLFYGGQFTEDYSGLDVDNPYLDDKPKYEKDLKTNKYVIVNDIRNAKQNYDDNHKSILPRMWSAEHSANYMEIAGPVEFSIKREYSNEQRLVDEVDKFKQAYNEGLVDSEDYNKFLKQFGDYLDVEKPSFIQNIGFMFEFQFGYMYWRYFMWNYAGRQDDVQGRYDNLHGNWISGIPFVDKFLVGSQKNIPTDALENKGRNTYFFLPLIIGLIGFLFHAKFDKKSFWVLLVFFLFTGLALKVYLNERPFEPRERDYALVGSFYVFAIWIGYGAYAIYEMLREKISPKIAIPIALGATLLASPVLLASQNWDDHDRSNRYTAQSMARMYLDSIEENGIIFTIGDNDTFALWYLQNVEGYRRDVRVINTALFATDWYIDDMKKKAFDSDPIPSQLTHEEYKWGSRDFVVFQPTKKDTIDIKTWMSWIANESEVTKFTIPSSGQVINTFPSKTVRIPVNKDAVLANGVVQEKDADKIVDYIDMTINEDIIYKNTLMMLDIIANNDWKRPIYFSGGSFGDNDYLWMKDYLQLDGVVYKLVPIETKIDPDVLYDMGRIDSDKMYDIVMAWDWGNSGSPDIYHDVETRRNGLTYRSNLARLAETLINEKKFKKAEDILDLAMEKMPVDKFDFYSLLEPFVLGYYEIGKNEKGLEIYRQLAKIYQEKLLYFSGFTTKEKIDLNREIYTDMERYRAIVNILIAKENNAIYEKEVSTFNGYIGLFPYLYSPKEGINLDNKSRIETDMDIPLDSTLLELLEENLSTEMQTEEQQ
ncbi:membrane protein [Patiriisocius marinus]|uniref:Membrane protein n=1 Tax=Patiriisocius marinus TaxID=1397112 RepID=A0A5J4IUH5_9FLAO|nr:DUF2723 domain-containing protein [Patiriisocius marinus]GER58346.1 membrane protein [Patiriisocius marinus]